MKPNQVSKMDSKFEKEFYQDIDNSHHYSKWRIVFICFIGLVLVIVAGFYYGYSLVKMQKNNPALKVSDEDSQKVADAIQYVFETPGQPQLVEINQQELSSYLFVQTEQGSHRVKNLQAEILPNQIVLTGKMLNPIETTFEASIIPELVNGHVVLSVNNVTIGELSISKPLINLFGKKYTVRLNEIFSQPSNMVINQVSLDSGKMTLVGTVNP